MILKKIDKDGVVKAIYKSSNIIASKYDKVNEALTITFNKGTNYTYSGVPNTDYTRFEIAESQGKVFNTHIKKHPFVKNEDIDPSKIEIEIEKHQIEKIKEIETSLIKSMNNISKYYEKNNVIDDSLLTNVQFLISKLKNEKNG